VTKWIPVPVLKNIQKIYSSGITEGSNVKHVAYYKISGLHKPYVCSSFVTWQIVGTVAHFCPIPAKLIVVYFLRMDRLILIFSTLMLT
jgi:hypothetical protein